MVWLCETITAVPSSHKQEPACTRTHKVCAPQMYTFKRESNDVPAHTGDYYSLRPKEIWFSEWKSWVKESWKGGGWHHVRKAEQKKHLKGGIPVGWKSVSPLAPGSPSGWSGNLSAHKAAMNASQKIFHFGRELVWNWGVKKMFLSRQWNWHSARALRSLGSLRCKKWKSNVLEPPMLQGIFCITNFDFFLVSGMYYCTVFATPLPLPLITERCYANSFTQVCKATAPEQEVHLKAFHCGF